MIMVVKTPGSQMGSPAEAERGAEARRGGAWRKCEFAIWWYKIFLI